VVLFQETIVADRRATAFTEMEAEEKISLAALRDMRHSMARNRTAFGRWPGSSLLGRSPRPIPI
jgi:hypothetical protein